MLQVQLELLANVHRSKAESRERFLFPAGTVTPVPVVFTVGLHRVALCTRDIIKLSRGIMQRHIFLYVCMYTLCVRVCIFDHFWT